MAKRNYTWKKFFGYVGLYALFLGLAWAGPAIGLLLDAMGASQAVGAVVLGSICALGWMAVYFPSKFFKKADKVSSDYTRFKKGWIGWGVNAFGTFNGLVNGVITFFGSSVALNTWMALLSIHLGFYTQLILCLYAAVVGALASLWITRERLNQVSYKVFGTQWVWKDVLSWNFGLALLCALFAAGSSMVMAYYSGFFLFAKMATLLGPENVAMFAFLGTAVGQQALAIVLTLFTFPCATSLYIVGMMDMLKGGVKQARKVGWGRWLLDRSADVLGIVAAATQTFTVFRQLTSLWSSLSAFRGILGVSLGFIFGNFSLNFTSSMKDFIAVVMGDEATPAENVAGSGDSAGRPSERGESRLSAPSNGDRIPVAPVA